MSPAALEALIILAAKYGPGFVASIIALFKKDTITVEEVHALFANVKPYESYNIPDAEKKSATP